MNNWQLKRNYREISTQFLDMARGGASGFEITKQLGLSVKQAKDIHFDLLRKGKIPHTIRLEFASLGKPEVAEKGNIFITSQRLAYLGLEDIFPPFARLAIERDGDSIVIRREPEDDEFEMYEDRKPKKKSLLGRIFGGGSGKRLSQAQED